MRATPCQPECEIAGASNHRRAAVKRPASEANENNANPPKRYQVGCAKINEVTIRAKAGLGKDFSRSSDNAAKQ
jgi:hypothetical protein